MDRKHDLPNLTEQQAYSAMLHFLEAQFGRTGSDDIGALLGSASLLDDGRPADPAIADEWRACVVAALSNYPDKAAAE